MVACGCTIQRCKGTGAHTTLAINLKENTCTNEHSHLSFYLGPLMKHLYFSAPVVAFGSAALLVGVGAAWWIVISAFFLTAPCMIGLAVLLCNTILPCDKE